MRKLSVKNAVLAFQLQLTEDATEAVLDPLTFRLALRLASV